MFFYNNAYYHKRQIKQMYMIVQDCMCSYYYMPVFINRSCNCACINDMYFILFTKCNIYDSENICS